MNHKRPYSESEGGNAVTLTLLGLAVAILAGVGVLYWIGRSTPQQVVPLTPSESISTTSDQVFDPRAGWQTYTDSEYGFSIQFPPGWLVATGTLGVDPVITLAPGQSNASTSLTYHSVPTRVSIYPHGGTLEEGLGFGEQSTVIVTVQQASAKDALLGSKRPWATIALFEKYPTTWANAGYVLARAQVEEELLTYFQGETEITADMFDASRGDRIVRQGYVDPTVRAIEEEILRSFQFTQHEDVSETNVGDLIEVSRPQNGDVVSSPLTVQGKARGNWYFEGSFPVRLETDRGEVLAEVPATARDEWMTEEFVPFELSLAFPASAATSGVLVLKKDNPSGLPEFDGEIRVSVLFSQEE